MLDLLPQALAAAYGSLQAPNYAFVDRALRRRPYRELVAALEQAFAVEEITEPNYDVSFAYVLEDGSAYLLHLSMVGPFAVLFPFSADRVVGPALATADSAEAAVILRLLSQHGVTVVDAPTLSLRTEVLDIESSSGQTLSIYQAVFTYDGS
jgi:hypothetical protein